MALQVNLTDPATGTPHPEAYARVEDANLALASDVVTISVVAYHDQSSFQTDHSPVYTYPTFFLTQSEIEAPNPAFVTALANLVLAGQINSPKDALKACLYVLLKNRAEFSEATDVP